MSVECSNTRLTTDVLFRRQRQEFIESLSDYLPRHDTSLVARPPHSTAIVIEPFGPLESYSLLFAEYINEGIQRRVAVAYADARRTRAELGWVYVFRDTRDGNAGIVKIGSTTGTARRRVAQWRRELGNATADELSLLFAVRSSDVRLCERVVHRLLFCQWLAKRVNRATGRRLVEYFYIVDLIALKLLIASVARHTDWYAAHTHHARQRYSTMQKHASLELG